MNKIKQILSFLISATIIISCANRGTPSGGDIDQTPPVITKSEPENYTTNFSSEEIKIYFNEYIKFKNLQKNLIISPPIDPIPEITPMGFASKYIKIKFLKPLQKNSTYVFNFGESIVDNNADNVFSNYKYVFSTGSYIDSLSIKGRVFDALDRETPKDISIVLHEIDSIFHDSIIYKSKPKYVTRLIDSTGTFSLTNLKNGNYLLIALNEEDKDYIFQSKSDKIGFHKQNVELPKDSLNNYTIKLFKESAKFKFGKPKQLSNNSIAFGFEGDLENPSINLISKVDSSFTSHITKVEENDTLYYWFKSNTKIDSLKFLARNKSYSDTLKIKITETYNDSLKITSLQNSYINFLEDVRFQGNTPFKKLDTTKISVLDKDSLKINYSYSLDKINNNYIFNFYKEEEDNYTFNFLPGAFEDIYSTRNDSLSYTFKTKTFDDYGNLRLNIINAEYPIIVQLLNKMGEIKYEKLVSESQNIDFKYIIPAKYFVRVIFDSNSNNKYDSGNYFQKKFPERVSHLVDELDVRAGWDLIQEFILK